MNRAGCADHPDGIQYAEYVYLDPDTVPPDRMGRTSDRGYDPELLQ